MIGKSKQFTIINTQTTTSHLNSLNTKITTALRYSVGNPYFGLREPQCFYLGGGGKPITGDWDVNPSFENRIFPTKI